MKRRHYVAALARRYFDAVLGGPPLHTRQDTLHVLTASYDRVHRDKVIDLYFLADGRFACHTCGGWQPREPGVALEAWFAAHPGAW